MRKIPKRVRLTLLFTLCASALTAQSVGDYFESVCNTYAQLKNYKARIGIQVQNQKEMVGTLYVDLLQNRVRIDFNTKEVICIADNQLTVYDPNQMIVLEQVMEPSGKENGKGLSLLKKYYKYSYIHSYQFEPLEKNSQEEVIKLKFDAKWGNLEFKNLKIAFTADRFIRRIEGTTFSGSRVILNITNVEKNSTFSDQLFRYEAPGNAHAVKNFIYTPGK